MGYRYSFEEKYLKKVNTRNKKRFDSKDVVLMRMDLIGDCTMFTSAAYAIRDYYKDNRMVVICLQSTRYIFERIGVFDDIISIDIKPDNVNQDVVREFIRNIQTKQYDLLLQPQASRYPVADIIAAAVHANKKIAIELLKDNCGEKWTKYDKEIFDEFIPFSKDIVSEFDYYGAFVRGLGIDYKTEKPRLPYYDTKLAKGKYYVMCPGGSLSVKFWPAKNFAELADYIYKKAGYVCIIIGTKNEQWIYDKVRQYVDPRTRMSMINMMGKTNIFDVIDLIGNAQFVLTNDTSSVHIACATNTPSVSTVGGWVFGRFLPYKLENTSESDNIPLVACSNLPCGLCKWDREYIKEVNPKCLDDLDTGRPCQCIRSIDVSKVKKYVGRILDDCSSNPLY